MEPKSWYLSKTIWFNVIATALDILALTQFGAVIPATWAPYIALAHGVGNVLLRRISAEPITFGSPRALGLLLAGTLALPLVACGGPGVNLRPAAIASETFSVALKGLQTQFVQWSDAGLISRDDERRWQGVFRTMAQAGLAVDAAILAGDQRSIVDNANALATLAETLIAQEIVRLPASQQAIVRTAIVSLRGFIAIWQALQTPVASVGSPGELRAVLTVADARTSVALAE